MPNPFLPPIARLLSEQAMEGASQVQQRLASTMLVADEHSGMRPCPYAGKLPDNLGEWFPLARCRVCRKPSDLGLTCFGCLGGSDASATLPTLSRTAPVAGRAKARHRR